MNVLRNSRRIPVVERYQIRAIESITLPDVRKRMIDRLLNRGEIAFDTDDDTGEILIPTGFYRNAATNAIQDTKDPNWDDESETGEEGDDDG